MSIEYSADIRSARDTAFLHWALHALQQQSVLPREILIVIPYDAVPWETGCSLVRSIQTEQGMVTQGDPELQDIAVYALREDGAFVSALARQGARAIMVSGAQFEYLGGTTLLDLKKFYVRFRPQVYIHYLSRLRCLKSDFERTLFDKFYVCRMCSWYVLGVFFLAVIILLKHRTFRALCGACDAVYVCYWRDVLSASKEGA
ncbi:MAG: hypothetical protein MRJ66_16405 [Nitrospira sp.]|nr:hypothetical protein [Nitrospira sp.]